MKTKFAHFKSNRQNAINANRKVVTHIRTIKAKKLLDPLLVYNAVLLKTKLPACLLESAVHTGSRGRYSYICLKGSPFAVMQEIEGGSLSSIKDKFSAECPMPHKDLPFIGGAVGYIGHDAINSIETTVKANRVDPFGLPVIALYFYSSVIVFDHEKNVLHYISNVETALSEEEGFKKACCEIEEMEQYVNESVNTVIPIDKVSVKDVESNLSQAEYEEMVVKAKEHIPKGDVFQVVLSRRLSVPFEGSGVSFYQALRISNPSRYLFHMRLDESCRNAVLAGASPEIMSDIQKRKMIIRPLAGTKKRGTTPEEDRQIEEGMLCDEKETAEHRMLVDLARNDIARFCEAKSIKVTRLMKAEYFRYLMHIGSEVVGKLRKGVHPLDACVGSLPAGTLSGAPKVRALQIISEFEPSRRGPYGGALGWFTDKSLDTCIFIRSALLLEGKLYWQTGAGIVADSIPKDEYIETENKAKGIMNALKQIDQDHEE